ncbi:hypothetical protein AALA22_08965 [Anaerovoracaceae bacterium 41-7]
MSHKRRPDETEQAYIYRICSMKDQIGTWYDVADILNAELNKSWTESAYRKKYQAGQAFILENQDVLYEGESYLSKLREERDALQRERYKLQTEKIEYNRWLREHARDDLFEEKVLQSISEHVGRLDCPTPIKFSRNERCGILMIADMHFGAEFKMYGLNDEVINEYSPEIFYNRMENLLSQIIEYVKKEDIKYLKVFNLGDSLDGFIRHDQLFNLRYGVIDSAIIFGDYMGRWLHRLSEIVGVEFHQTAGNHGEMRLLDGRKGAHLNDNIEKVTCHIIDLINADNPNFTLVENKTGLIFTNAVGWNIIGIHGEVKDQVAALREYSDMYDVKIDYLAAGHMHHNKYSNCGIRKGVIGIGSMMGIDEYSVKLRKSADATASLIIFEKDKGKTDEHTFILN